MSIINDDIPDDVSDVSDYDDGYGYFGSESDLPTNTVFPTSFSRQWENIRECEQLVNDIDIEWLMTMMC